MHALKTVVERGHAIYYMSRLIKCFLSSKKFWAEKWPQKTVESTIEVFGITPTEGECYHSCFTFTVRKWREVKAVPVTVSIWRRLFAWWSMVIRRTKWARTGEMGGETKGWPPLLSLIRYFFYIKAFYWYFAVAPNHQLITDVHQYTRFAERQYLQTNLQSTAKCLVSTCGFIIFFFFFFFFNLFRVPLPPVLARWEGTCKELYRDNTRNIPRYTRKSHEVPGHQQSREPPFPWMAVRMYSLSFVV
jgi:hypothetical protein